MTRTLRFLPQLCLLLFFYRCCYRKKQKIPSVDGLLDIQPTQVKLKQESETPFLLCIAFINISVYRPQISVIKEAFCAGGFFFIQVVKRTLFNIFLFGKGTNSSPVCSASFENAYQFKVKLASALERIIRLLIPLADGHCKYKLKYSLPTRKFGVAGQKVC